MKDKIIEILKIKQPRYITEVYLQKYYKELYAQIIKATEFLIFKPTVSERLYCIINDITIQRQCQHCHQPFPGNFFSYSSGYHSDFCSTSCSRKHTGLVAKNERDAILPKCANPDCDNKVKKIAYKFCCYKCMGTSEDVLAKRRKTCIQKYGVDNVSKDIDIINKIHGTKNDRTPEEITQSKDKQKQTCLDRHGVDNMFKDKELIKKSMMAKHGGEYPMQIVKFFVKNYNYKPYTLPSGKVIKVQGYEPLALDILLRQYKEEDLVTEHDEMEKLIGKIMYDDNKHRYFPDIYIKSTNTIIEVKSTYTYTTNLEKNKLKQEACESREINFKIMIFDRKRLLATPPLF